MTKTYYFMYVPLHSTANVKIKDRCIGQLGEWERAHLYSHTINRVFHLHTHTHIRLCLHTLYNIIVLNVSMCILVPCKVVTWEGRREVMLPYFGSFMSLTLALIIATWNNPVVRYSSSSTQHVLLLGQSYIMMSFRFVDLCLYGSLCR